MPRKPKTASKTSTYQRAITGKPSRKGGKRKK